MDVLMVKILSAKTPEDIFTNDLDKIKTEFRNLAKKYHPDVNKSPEANECFRKINELYNIGVDKINKGIWTEKDVIYLETTSNKKIRIKYFIKKDFELGECYICKEHVIYILKKEFEKYYNNAIKMIKNVSYASKSMEEEFKKYIPDIQDTFKLKNGNFTIVLRKQEDTYCLEDLLKQQGGEITPRHVAWMLSRLNNINCFLQYNKIVLNGISLQNCYVSPRNHCIMIYGGWWYATKVNEKMIGTQKVIFDLMPVKNKGEKISSYMTDTESIKYIGRQLLNNLNLNKTTSKGEIIPGPLTEWLRTSGENAIENFTSWNGVLDKSWGERKFVKLEVSEKDIYNI